VGGRLDFERAVPTIKWLVSGVVAFDNWDKGFMEKKMSPECK
jgi:hypothetical protein